MDFQPGLDVPSSSMPPPGAPPGMVTGGWQPPAPTVAWEPPRAEGDGITVSGVLRDTFARYAADPIRIFLVGLVPSVLVLFVYGQPGPTLLVSLLSLAATAIVMALGDRGRSASLASAVGLGLRRMGWLLVIYIVIAALIFGAAILPLIVFSIVLGPRNPLILVLTLLLLIPLLWIYVRLTLAVPAVVVDQLRPNAALNQARAATRSLGAAFRLFVIVLVAGLVSTPVGLAAGALIVVDGLPDSVIYLIGGVLAAFVAPLGGLALVSAYRRVYPRFEVATPPAFPAPEVPPDELFAEPLEVLQTMAAAQPPVESAPPTQPVAVPAPPFGRVARGLVGATLAIGIGGLTVFALTIGAIAGGALVGSTGNVPRGTVVFGTAADLRTCTVTGQFTELAQGGSVSYVASFTRRTAATDRIRLVIVYDGAKIVDALQPPGAYDCLGSPEPETGLPAGRYEMTLYVNDEASASGGFTAR